VPTAPASDNGHLFCVLAGRSSAINHLGGSGASSGGSETRIPAPPSNSLSRWTLAETDEGISASASARPARARIKTSSPSQPTAPVRIDRGLVVQARWCPVRPAQPEEEGKATITDSRGVAYVFEETGLSDEEIESALPVRADERRSADGFRTMADRLDPPQHRPGPSGPEAWNWPAVESWYRLQLRENRRASRNGWRARLRRSRCRLVPRSGCQPDALERHLRPTRHPVKSRWGHHLIIA